MTPILRILTTAAATAALALSLAACAGTSSTPAPTSSPGAGVTTAACTGDEGVTVVVDASALGDAAPDPTSTFCVPATAPIAAADALSTAGIATEGTEEYGDQVVCRVNGLPAEDEALPATDGSDYFETCKAMPAAFAYWSLWVKPAGGVWDYAQESAETQMLQPGDAVELLFTLNGEPAQPAS